MELSPKRYCPTPLKNKRAESGYQYLNFKAECRIEVDIRLLFSEKPITTSFRRLQLCKCFGWNYKAIAKAQDTGFIPIRI